MCLFSSFTYVFIIFHKILTLINLNCNKKNFKLFFACYKSYCINYFFNCLFSSSTKDIIFSNKVFTLISLSCNNKKMFYCFVSVIKATVLLIFFKAQMINVDLGFVKQFYSLGCQTNGSKTIYNYQLKFPKTLQRSHAKCRF
jgi:hypothetical protein